MHFEINDWQFYNFNYGQDAMAQQLFVSQGIINLYRHPIQMINIVYKL